MKAIGFFEKYHLEFLTRDDFIFTISQKHLSQGKKILCVVVIHVGIQMCALKIKIRLHFIKRIKT